MATRSSTSLALSIVLFFPLVLCKRYDLAVGWNISVTSKAPVFEAAEQAGSYRILHAMTEDELILSDNGTFGLSFFSFNGSSSYYLSVIIGTSSFANGSANSGSVVWTANRNAPVSANGSLHISQNGTLELLDSDGKILWSPTHKAAISSIELEETGNFILYSSNGSMLWQSFDKPCDVLLEGQQLYTGQKLVSSANSSTLAEGNFEGVVDKSGFGLFLRPSQQPYFLWPLQNAATADVGTIAAECPTYETVVTYNASLLNMFYQKNGSSPTPNNTIQACSADPKKSITLTASPGMLHHLKLAPSGTLLRRSYDSLASVWTTITDPALQTLVGSCPPLSCPDSTICLTNGQCQCMNQAAPNNRTCQPLSNVPLSCTALEAENHYLWHVAAASYFSTKFARPDKTTSVEDCQNSCRSNCSCRALVYNQTDSSCFFLKEVHGGMASDTTSDTWIKLQNQTLVLPTPGKKSSKNSLLVIVAAVSSSLVAVILMVAFCLWRTSNLLPLPSSHSKKKLVNGLVSGAASAAVVLACSILLLCYYRSKKAMADAELMKLLLTMDGPPIKFSYSRLVAATKDFSKKLGSGGFGSVYEGAFHDGKKVAVKRLHSKNQGQRQFISEVASLGMINHINIVKLFGFCADSSHRLLVYNYMPKGSLDKWIFANSGLPLSWSLRNSIALGIARGLAYLHEESPEPILHLDIKPQNILLDDNFVAKVADFGMARLLMSREVSQVVTGVKGTPGYLAPEWLLEAAATKKCDVYSYGMVLLELIGGRRNLDMEKLESDNDSWFFPAWAVKEVRRGSTMNIIDPKVREQARQVEAETLVRVALWCIQETPADRPTMTTVVQMLEGEQEISEPPMNFHFAVQATGILSITASKECTTLASFVRH